MDPVTVDLLLPSFGEGPRATSGDAARDAIAAELALLLKDLGLDVEFAIDVRDASAMEPGERTTNDFRMSINGRPMASHRIGVNLALNMAATLHANAEELVGATLADHLWRAWGGTSVTPPRFAPLLRQLVRHHVRPARVEDAITTWNEEDSPQLFEDSLGQASRRILIHVHPDRVTDIEKILATDVVGEPDGTSGNVAMIRDGLFYELGILVGDVGAVGDTSVGLDSFRIQINDVRSAPRWMLKPHECLVNDTVARLRLLGISGVEAVNPANGSACAIMSGDNADLAEEAGLTTWDLGGSLLLTVSAALRRSAPALLSRDVVQYQLDKLELAFPHLASQVRDVIGITLFTRVLRHLLDEEISIRNWPRIIDNIATTPCAMPQLNGQPDGEPAPPAFLPVTPGVVASPTIADPLAARLVESVRVGLKRHISHKHTRGGKTLVAYLLGPEVEEQLRLDRQLFPHERQQIVDAIASELGDRAPASPDFTVLTNVDVRRRFRDELAPEFPAMSVLSYTEITADMNIQPIGRIERVSAHHEKPPHDASTPADEPRLGKPRPRTADAYLEFMIHGFYNGLLTLQELEGIADEEMETLYALGYNYFTLGKYGAAKDIFTGLTAYAPYTAHYWRALGAVNQQLEDYREAIAAYDMAIANDETDVVSYVYRGECQILSGNIEAGLSNLDTVLRLDIDPTQAAWAKRAELLIGIHRS